MPSNLDELRKIREEIELCFNFEGEMLEGSSDSYYDFPIERLNIRRFRPQLISYDKNYIFEVLRRGYLLNGEKLELNVGNEIIVLDNNGKNLELYKKQRKVGK